MYVAMRIALGTDQGTVILESRTKDDLLSWTFVSRAQQGRQIRCLVESTNNSILATGAHGVVYKTKDYQNWMASTAGLEGQNITSIGVHPSYPHIMYAGTTPPQMFFSDTAGLRWQQLDTFRHIPEAESWRFPLPPYRAKITGILFHPQYSDIVLASLACGGLLGSLDCGINWMERPLGIEREVNGITLHPLNPNRLFATTSTGIYRSDDLGSSWVVLDNGLPYMYARCLTISPGNPNFIMACISQSRESSIQQMMIRSLDGGDTWEVCINGLPDLTTQIVTCLDAIGDNCFAVGTSKGNVYLTSDGGQFWQHVHRDIAPINAILLQDTSAGLT